MPKDGILVGPGAAGLLGWDGFSPNDPTAWLVPHERGRCQTGVIRSRLWRPSTHLVDGVVVADPGLVLAHLLYRLDPLPRWPKDRNPIDPIDRVGVGLESFLRNGGVVPRAVVGRCTPSMTLVRDLYRRRGIDEPSTDSFLETRLIQLLTRNRIGPVFRQVPLRLDGAYVNRLDVVVGRRARALRPFQFCPTFGVAVEADGKEFHQDFERDRRRSNHIAMAGAKPVIVTYDMVERRPNEVLVPLRAMLAHNEPSRPSPK